MPIRFAPLATLARRLVPLAGIAAVMVMGANPAQAALPQGAQAPQFTTAGAKAGKTLRFDLRQALRRGPVVLYFYPKAFTQGCTLEAHAFAEATEEFARYGATVVGMSGDDLETLQKFSTEACRDKFTVAVATPRIIADYDVALRRPGAGAGLSDRTSYVINRDGRITMVHADMDYRDHVKLTLEAVKKLAK